MHHNLLLTVNSFSQFKASIYTESYFGLEVNLSEKISTELRFNRNKNKWHYVRIKLKIAH
ncbi:hypothetical protein [Polaribacter sp. M15]